MAAAGVLSRFPTSRLSYFGIAGAQFSALNEGALPLPPLPRVPFSASFSAGSPLSPPPLIRARYIKDSSGDSGVDDDGTSPLPQPHPPCRQLARNAATMPLNEHSAHSIPPFRPLLSPLPLPSCHPADSGAPRLSVKHSEKCQPMRMTLY